MIQVPILSICIPTYNRAEYLEKSLNSLVMLDEFPQIEVVISDNCSTDGTQVLCERFCSRYPNIVYHRNEENIFDRNFPAVLMRATGVYRKLCNDSLLYESGSLKYIIGIVTQNIESRPFLFFLNGRPTFRKKLREITYCDDFDTFCYLAGCFLTSIACFGLWENQIDDLEEEFVNCEQHLWQTCKALKIVSQNKNALVLTKALFRAQYIKNKDVSYGIYTVFFEIFPKLLKEYVDTKKLSEKTCKLIRKDTLYIVAGDLIKRINDTDSQYDFGEQSDFMSLILKDYRNEAYYLDFIIKYKLGLWWQKNIVSLREQMTKNRFGKILLFVKRKLRLRLY